MSETDEGLIELTDAPVLVGGLWIQKDVPESAVAWTMMIEAVDRLAVLHGPARTGHLLGELVREVQGRPLSRGLL